MPILHFVETCLTQDRTENSRAPPMRHHGFKMARRVSDTYEMCDCFILSCSKNVLIYRNIHFSIHVYGSYSKSLRYFGFSQVITFLRNVIKIAGFC